MMIKLLATLTACILVVSAAPLRPPAASNHVSAPPDAHINFTYGVDERTLRPRIFLTGSGNNEFEGYVNSRRTAYAKGGVLYVRPTLMEHVMEDLNAVGNLYVAKTRNFINNTAQPWSHDDDFYFGGPFAGRRMVLPYKHVRYQTELSNFCDDTASANPDPSSCTNQWEHAYNVFDLSTQAWGSGRWDDARCTGACLQTAGDYAAESGSAFTYTMIQPVASAELITRTHLDMRFGRLEVRAKLPRGDWLWPAIWLLPSYPDNYGGTWPASGEIDVMESRGNNPATCAAGGYNTFGSTLHWGPEWDHDAYLKTTTQIRFSQRNTTLIDDFHIYGLLWNSTGIYTYLDDPSQSVLSVDMSTNTFWQYGQQNSTRCVQKDPDTSGFDGCVQQRSVPGQNWAASFANPWQSPNNFSVHMSPFDAPFYLMMNVAVGGTNGYFSNCNGSDGSAQPWGSADPNELPIDSFMKNSFRWLPTWVEPSNYAWAAHCSLGSAFELCMPSNASCPVKDMTQPGASDQLLQWYQANSAKCTDATTASACIAKGSACEWHTEPCPEVADHAALQVSDIMLWNGENAAATVLMRNGRTVDV